MNQRLGWFGYRFYSFLYGLKSANWSLKRISRNIVRALKPRKQMEHFTKILEKIATAKGIVVLIIAATLAFFVYKNFDFMTEVTFKIDRPKVAANPKTLEGHTTKGTPSQYSLSMPVVQVTPSAFRIPSYFYAEIRNAGPDSAKDVEIIADLGKAQADQVDVNPSDRCFFSSDTRGSSILRIQCTEVSAREAVYVYALTTLPTFQEIIVCARASVSPIEYSWSDSQLERRNSGFLSSTMIRFLQFMTGALILVFCVYFAWLAIVLLNKKFKV
jgi:hypothetical protein